MEIVINEDQRLFVFKSSESVSCLGFDVVYGYCRELTRRIKKLDAHKPDFTLPPILESESGTLKQYQQYQSLLERIGNRKTGTWFDHATPVKVRSILERYRQDGGTIRIFYGDRKSGRCWLEENDVLGRVGRSTGTMQIPLLIGDGEYGGPGILDSCIVRIIDGNIRAELYRQASYHLPEMDLRPIDNSLVSQGYTHGVWAKDRNGNFINHANFTSYGKAAQWIAFMSGECTEQPH
jgi:hypothetical protein